MNVSVWVNILIWELDVYLGLLIIKEVIALFKRYARD
nr:MAG TPA: hypothetical protein [Caudoviricetes sp.]